MMLLGRWLLVGMIPVHPHLGIGPQHGAHEGRLPGIHKRSIAKVHRGFIDRSSTENRAMILRLRLRLRLEIALEKVTRGGGRILPVEGPVASTGDIAALPGIIHILRRFFRWNPANPIEGHTLAHTLAHTR